MFRYLDRWAACQDDEASDDADDIELTEADVLLHRLDADLVREALRRALRLTGSPDQLGPRLDCLGTCGNGPKRRRVYWYRGLDDADSHQAVQEVDSRAGADGCVLLPVISESLDRSLSKAGISSVEMEGNLMPKAGGIPRDCGIACRHLQAQPHPVEALKEHLDARFDRVDRGVERVGRHVVEIENENALLKENLIAALVAVTTRVNAEFFRWICQVLARGSVSGAARDLNVAPSTFDEKLRRYADQGGAYKTLYSLVAIRRRGVGAKAIGSYNDLFLAHNRSSSAEDSDVVRGVIEGLSAMNPANWPQIQRELLDSLLQ
ncbi:MAG: hypothetical protein H6827_10735 [Planctomycetes bacterium]|nr:hypothetical protein [Planctomycetota bacterium]